MEVAPFGQGANGQIPSPNHATTIDPEVLLRHLVDLLRITLEASEEDLERKGSLLSDAKRSDTIQRCLRFASESQVVLYIQKDLVSTEAPNGIPNGHDASGKKINGDLGSYC